MKIFATANRHFRKKEKMGKSKVSSKSKIKITNKSSNKRMKSKRKHKFNKSVVQTQVTTSNFVKKDRKEENHVLPACEDDEEIIEDGLDKEMLDYINENAQTLLSSNLR